MASVLLATALVVPARTLDSLLCLYCPLKVELIVTECPPDELCFKADGRYGNHSALAARGCMAKKDCSQVHKLRFRGTVYTMSYACCDGPYCNSCPLVTAGLLAITLTLITVAVMAAMSAASA
uniref:UPAR/Ly6 domain-containing protein n=1 Tax=Scophthalmus maximus TaxID=52904 RepID=A0A8D3AE34_SCOMX